MFQFVAEGLGMTIAQLAGVFNVLAGLMLVASIIFLVAGIIIYAVHMGLPQRVEGTEYMITGVRILWALFLVVFITRFIERHLNLMLALLGVGIVVYVLYLLLRTKAGAGAGSER